MSVREQAAAGSRSGVALVSGANKGIGYETARQLGKLGYIVYLGSRDAMKGEIAARRMRAEGVDARVVKLDVTRQADIAAAATKIEKECGVLDALVNNAGVMQEKSWTVNSTSATDLDALRSTFEANVFAVVAVTQAMLPLLRKSAAGRIVNVSSILGSVSYQASPASPTYGTKLFAYNSSKAALNMFTISLAHELRKTAIKVNSSHPGWVRTDLGGSGAPTLPAEGAKTQVLLATLAPDGPTGGFFHEGKAIPW